MQRSINPGVFPGSGELIIHLTEVQVLFERFRDSDHDMVEHLLLIRDTPKPHGVNSHVDVGGFSAYWQCPAMRLGHHEMMQLQLSPTL
jgi:hypothetical protein